MVAAKEAGIPIMQNVPLASALFSDAQECEWTQKTMDEMSR